MPAFMWNNRETIVGRVWRFWLNDGRTEDLKITQAMWNSGDGTLEVLIGTDANRREKQLLAGSIAMIEAV